MKFLKVRKDNVIAFILCVICLFLVGFLVYVTDRYVEEVKGNEFDKLETISDFTASSVSTYLKNYMDMENSFAESLEFLEGLGVYEETGETTQLTMTSNNYMRSFYPGVADIRLYKKEKELVNLRNRKYEILEETGMQDIYSLSFAKDEDEKTYFCLGRKTKENYLIEFYLDCDILYYQLLAPIRFEGKGYISVQTRGGVVLAHPVREQIGLHVITDRERLFPDVDLDGVRRLYSLQESGQEGSLVFRSYWWDTIHEPSQRQERKAVAFRPVQFGEGFFVVNVVVDYESIFAILAGGLLKMLLILFLLLIVMTVTARYAFQLMQHKKTFERENIYLKELNRAQEELMLQERKLSHQQRLQLIGAMTGGIAHEFNNLLTPIMGYSGLLKEVMGTDSPYYEDVTEIYDASERAKEIIVQIAGLSRKNTETVIQTENIGELLERCMKMVESVRPDAITVETKIYFDEEYIFGNKTQLNQVLLNICVNAFQAIGNQKGKVTVDGEIVSELPESLKAENIFHKDKFTKITVRDTGCGMTESVRSKIFEPFFTTKKEGEGVGLGLAMVQSIMEEHHGLIEVESQYGEGTAIILYLPVCEVGEKETEEEVFLDDTQKTVLLLSDNLKVLRTLKRILLQKKINVLEHDNFEASLQDIKTQNITLALVDFDQKEMSGVDLALEIKALDKKIKVLLMTGIWRKEIIMAKESGIIDDYIDKPIIIAHLLKKMKELTEEVEYKTK